MTSVGQFMHFKSLGSPASSSTVARWPKIQQNNSKWAIQNIFWRIILLEYGPPILVKSGRKHFPINYSYIYQGQFGQEAMLKNCEFVLKISVSFSNSIKNTNLNIICWSFVSNTVGWETLVRTGNSVDSYWKSCLHYSQNSWKGPTKDDICCLSIYIVIYSLLHSVQCVYTLKQW